MLLSEVFICHLSPESNSVMPVWVPSMRYEILDSLTVDSICVWHKVLFFCMDRLLCLPPLYCWVFSPPLILIYISSTKKKGRRKKAPKIHLRRRQMGTYTQVVNRMKIFEILKDKNNEDR